MAITPTSKEGLQIAVLKNVVHVDGQTDIEGVSTESRSS